MIKIEITHVDKPSLKLSDLVPGEYFTHISPYDDAVYLVIDPRAYSLEFGREEPTHRRFVNLSTGLLDGIDGKYWDVRRIKNPTFTGEEER